MSAPVAALDGRCHTLSLIAQNAGIRGQPQRGSRLQMPFGLSILLRGWSLEETVPSSARLTALLDDWGRGDRHALDQLVPLVYAELRRIAAGQLRRESPGHTLQPTALVHEAYLRLFDQRHVEWQSRAHFYGVAAQIMRRILVDHARRRQAVKRGDGVTFVSLDEAVDAASMPLSVIDLHTALERLEQLDPTLGRIVELRAFGGLTVEEAAHVLQISPSTAKREWRAAKAWLTRELAPEARS